MIKCYLMFLFRVSQIDSIAFNVSFFESITTKKDICLVFINRVDHKILFRWNFTVRIFYIVQSQFGFFRNALWDDLFWRHILFTRMWTNTCENCIIFVSFIISHYLENEWQIQLSSPLRSLQLLLSKLLLAKATTSKEHKK